jgi:hypothetical protein
MTYIRHAGEPEGGLPCAQEESLVAETRSLGLTNALDEASISRFHLRAVLVSGMGFFTDAYDLFVIGIAATLIKQQWHLGLASWLANAATLAAASWVLVLGPDGRRSGP